MMAARFDKFGEIVVCDLDEIAVPETFRIVDDRDDLWDSGVGDR